MQVTITSEFIEGEDRFDYHYETLDGKKTHESRYWKDHTQLTMKEIEFLAEKVVELERKLSDIRRLTL